ncbi:MAG: IS66 family transposase, partial [Proteobacteria bacterium]|nr:IS66 family transposase [Pseudomonadota bacterium]
RRVLVYLSGFRKKDYLQCLLLSDAKRHEKANQPLRAELEAVKKSRTRSQQQLHSLLGVKPAPSDEADTDNPSTTKKKKRGKKRGAPKGHTGCTWPIPQTVDHITIIPPPEQCPHCQGKMITPCDDFIDKYSEDIPAVLKVVTQHRYQKGECQHCYTMRVDERATQGPPVSLGDNLKITLTLLRHEMGVTYRKLSQFNGRCCKGWCRWSVWVLF